MVHIFVTPVSWHNDEKGNSDVVKSANVSERHDSSPASTWHTMTKVDACVQMFNYNVQRVDTGETKEHVQSKCLAPSSSGAQT